MAFLSKIHRIIRNPAFGLVPMLLFSILILHTDTRLAAGVGLSLSLIGYFLVKKFSRLIYKISITTFIVTLLLSFSFFNSLPLLNRFMITEIVFLISLILMRLSRGRIVLRVGKGRNYILKNYMKESFRVAFQTQYGLSIHLLLVLVFYVTGSPEAVYVNSTTVLLLFQAILVAVIAIESVRLFILDKKLYKEEWLPVVTEKGDVTGRVAMSITKDMKNRFMHPVVRVALIYKGKIYLKERDHSRLLDPGKLDYPFEKYMQYNDEVDETLRYSIRKECGNSNLPLRFLLKYTFENEITKRLIFLYVADIEDENIFNSLQLQGGKLWTVSQIEDNTGTDIYSECFELEFEYLKNTVLLAHRFRKVN